MVAGKCRLDISERGSADSAALLSVAQDPALYTLIIHYSLCVMYNQNPMGIRLAKGRQRNVALRYFNTLWFLRSREIIDVILQCFVLV